MKSANKSLSIAQLESILKGTAVDLGTPGYDQYYGYGRINAEAAVAAAAASGGNTLTNSNVVADTTAPRANILNPKANSKVKGTVTVKLSASDNVGIASLTLYIDNVLRSSTNTGSLSFSWNTSTVSRGTHIIRATAKDAAGNITAKHISVSK